jgi:uncharacterized protein
MNDTSNTYMHRRVLKLNVGFLLNAGPGHSNNSELDLPAVRLSDDVVINYVRGPLRLSRTKEGVLVQAQLNTAVPGECYRCLDTTEHQMNIDLEELYVFHSSDRNAPFRIGEDAMLDMAPLLREEVLIEASHGALCAPDCQGLCTGCGINLNRNTCDCEVDDIDPRMAVLKKLLDSN